MGSFFYLFGTNVLYTNGNDREWCKIKGYDYGISCKWSRYDQSKAAVDRGYIGKREFEVGHQEINKFT